MIDAPAGSWRTSFHTAWRRLRGGELTPARAAASVAIGLAIGVTPLWGTHLVLVFAICMPLRLDVPIAYVAANISLPFIAPFLTIAEIEIGARVLTGEFLPLLSREAMLAHGVTPFLKEIAVGTLLFSPMMAALGGGITYVMVRASRGWTKDDDRADAFEAVALRVAERYARGRKFTRGYVQSKMRRDPVVRAVLALGQGEGRDGDGGGDAGLGDVADVGCGRGQLGIALLESRGARSVAGVDWDSKKVQEAARAGEGLPVTFTVGDIREEPRTPCDTALLIDVLHYFTEHEQDAMLDRIARLSRSCIVVRDLDPERGWRSRVTRLQETITTGLGINRGARLHIRPISAITRALEAHGFRTEVTPCWQGTPFANVLVVARRR
ncbi:DUF2062 domain-containing protein [Pendulispora albinea]|uniref:DUF2062 domain-containing protein n=1 Tax=Pendulispora albinea TaxID=2741071 RepID=A0ABZ2M2B9_9BACT